MIKLRLSAFTSESSDRDIAFQENENLKQLMLRALSSVNLEDEKYFEYFQVLVNGLRVEKDFWEYTVINEKDVVLIAPLIKGGSFGQIFKQIAVIAAVVVVSAYTGGGGLGFAGLGFSGAAVAGFTAAAAIGTTLLLNALIPPPVPGGFDIGGGLDNSLGTSQMYTITSQGNSSKKFGKVPKVYGTHRMFPTVAVNPYTEIETDPSTGDLVQYLYAVYDFGFGPLDINDIRIGDTPITQYSDITYNLVDLNKPAVSEGYWDDVLRNSFTFYKGDSEQDNTSVIINANQDDNGALEDYQVTRNAAQNPNNYKQEIILTFLNPNGLIAYGTNGESTSRTIELDIQFSKVGENVWKNFNDLSWVETFSVVGGDQTQGDISVALLPFTDPYFPYIPFEEDEIWRYQTQLRDQDLIKIYTLQRYGWPAGTNYIVLEDGVVNVGQALFYKGRVLGTVTSIEAYSSGYSKYNLSSPFSEALILFTRVHLVTWLGSNIVDDTYPVFPETDLSVNNKIFIKNAGRALITRRDNGQVYSTVKFSPRETGEFKVRITRVRTTSAYTYQTLDNLALSSLVTRYDRQPIFTDKRHVFLELKIRATNQLNGSISNLSAVCSSVLDVYDPDTETWSKQITSNPAWVYADLITGEVNKRSLTKDRLHLDSLVEWAEFCDEIPDAPTGQTFQTPRFRCNFILDFETTLQQLIGQVANAAQASLNIIDGKYGVLIDKRRTTPVQIFTPRNSSGFSSTRNYSTRPHALKIRYIDPTATWEIAEKIVYDDGYNFDNATEFEELSSFACTDPDQAWRFGRYMIAQNKLRQETISINVDFEYLVCTRGDFVQITQDVMKVGGTPARVISVGPTVDNPSWPSNRIQIDEGLETTVGSYGYVSRTVNGIQNSTLTVINSDTFDLAGPLPSVGDLIVIGITGQVVFDCIVKSITPNEDLTASLTLVEKADAIYDAESSDTIPDYSPQISITQDTEFLPPSEVRNLAVIANSWLCGANAFEYYITIDWDEPAGSAFEYFEIYVDDGRGYNIIDTTRDSKYTYFVDGTRLGLEHNFKILAVSSTGKKLDLGSITSVAATPLEKTTRPLNIASLGTNITGEVLQLDWEPIDDCISEYLIRYSPTLTGTWESSIPLLRTDKNTTLASTQARTGTYLIKAVDFNQNESQNATVAITTIPELTNLNVIQEITDFPALTGVKDQVTKNGNTLLIKNKVVGTTTTNEFYSYGYYYYSQFLDLGDIFTVRLQSLIQAEGYTVDDIMSNWVTLSSVTALANSRYSEWDVQTEYRTTDSYNVMADWTTLSSIDPISEGVQDNWTPWRRFSMGDGTGRIFQFRLKLISNKASVSPRVFDGTIKADMPDRIVSFENLNATPSGYVVTYNPAFKGPTPSPSVQITMENGQTGDYWEFDYKTLDGFKVIFYDSTGTPVSRTFDTQIKGFGRKSTSVI